MSVHRGGTIPACIAGGIPACLAVRGAGLGGGMVPGLGGGLLLGGCLLLGGEWWRPPKITRPTTRGEIGGIRSRPIAKGEIEGGIRSDPPWQLLLRAVRILLECVLVRSFFLRNFGITVIQDKPNGCWQICHFCVVGYLRKNSISIIFKRVSPLVQNHFIFVQFLRKNWPNYRFVSPMHYS